MYLLIRTADGVEIGAVERPQYIRKSAEGAYIETNEKDARGVAYLGVAYNLWNREPIGADETVMLVERDAGQTMSDTQRAVAANSDAIDNIIISMLEG